MLVGKHIFNYIFLIIFLGLKTSALLRRKVKDLIIVKKKILSNIVNFMQKWSELTYRNSHELFMQDLEFVHVTLYQSDFFLSKISIFVTVKFPKLSSTECKILFLKNDLLFYSIIIKEMNKCIYEVSQNTITAFKIK